MGLSAVAINGITWSKEIHKVHSSYFFFLILLLTLLWIGSF